MNSRKLPAQQPLIGVGLRHPHLKEALDTPSQLDFVEVHSENYFAQGGPLHAQLEHIAHHYPLSLHSTAMGVGSATPMHDDYLNKLSHLIELTNPILVSDHAAFCWGSINGAPVHSGDLLPLVYNQENLQIMVRNLDRIQQQLGRAVHIENLSTYLTLPGSTMTELEFLLCLHERTQCGLLVDLNNILVNAFNAKDESPLETGIHWIKSIPHNVIKEIHLAGFSSPILGNMAVDDHACAVSETCWSLYAATIAHHGAIPTLIEWDNALPEWQVLVNQAMHARTIAYEVLNHG
ncbi:DUF692 domain-containing protein [Bowmanella yangjiangensis]|uniref:DUF692 domain-containing protein n=1 Tax=Bowmanella yangjiangensis TaxID=2811230 RepID=A0ABS3CRT3_9ALTE|nr:DUF692 domain-containing protein [Bowmanella yangjiangensis]MBN7819812.1 DUF692 domain-containing protein [Bowmanella yangjiangensis]